MRRLAIIGISLVTTACSTTSPLVLPAAPIPNTWPKSSETTGQIDAQNTHWRKYFKDPRLLALIESGLKNNRDVHIAAARVAEARAQFAMSRADSLPAINLLGSGNISGLTTDLSGSTVNTNTKRFDINLGAASYEVDFWGRLARLTEAGRNNLLSSEEAQRLVELSLISDIAKTYFTQLHLKEVIELVSETVRSREEALAIIGKARDIGGTYAYEYQLASGILESSKAALFSAEQQLATTENLLNFLVGHKTNDLPAGLSFDSQELDDPRLLALPSEVLLNRPDILAAEYRLRATHANVEAARAAFLPKVLLSASIGVAGGGLSSVLSAGAWAFQPLISLPLFDGGRASAGVDIALARKNSAVAEYEKTIQVAFREVADQLAIRQSLSKQHAAVLSYRDSQATRLRISQARFAAGLLPYLDVLESQRDLLAAEQSVSQVRRAQLDSSVQFFKVLGGGIPAKPLESIASQGTTPSRVAP